MMISYQFILTQLNHDPRGVVDLIQGMVVMADLGWYHEPNSNGPDNGR